MISHMSYIDENSTIGENCKFGHNVIIGPNVKIGNNNLFGNNIVIHGNVNIGSGNYFSDFLSIGRPGEHRTKKYEFQEVQAGIINIGNDNIFREFVSIHSSIKNETRIGNDCSLFAYVHLSHDVHISDNVVLGNDCQLAGYTFIGKSSYLGFSCTVHPRTTLGAFCRIGMKSTINSDILPGMIAYGSPIRTKEVDSKFLIEKGFSDFEIDEIKNFYKNNNTKEDLGNHLSDISSTIFQKNIKDFIKRSTRRIVFPKN